MHLTVHATTDHVPLNYRITEERLATCWDLLSCDRCGLQISDWHLSDADINHLYETMEDDLYDQENASRRLTFHRGLDLIERFAKEKGVLLDVGCATGLFLLEANVRGWMSRGVDLSRWAVKLARGRALQIHEGTMHDVPQENGSCRAISMLDYIEHDPHPAEAIARAAQLLAPGGLLYITTPDCDGLLARLLGSRWWGINPLHLTYFSRRTMKMLLEQKGFEVLVSRHYTRVFTLDYWASRLAHFHPALAPFTQKIFRMLGISQVPFKLNLFDMMEVLARKK